MRDIQSSDEQWQMTPPLHCFAQPQRQQCAGSRLSQVTATCTSIHSLLVHVGSVDTGQTRMQVIVYVCRQCLGTWIETWKSGKNLWMGIFQRSRC